MRIILKQMLMRVAFHSQEMNYMEEIEKMLEAKVI